MAHEMDRRSFLKIGALGVGACTAGLLCGPRAFAEGKAEKKEDNYTIEKGTKGCHRCEKAITAIMNDPKMRREVEARFPEGAKINFYVRRQKDSTKVGEHSIAVGSCTRALQGKCDTYVRGCTRKIKTDYVFERITKQLKKI
ncbi:MAG: hypothetical protein ACYTGH_00050 [Planctomycetota bacterium]|jgi:hypothetical protein